MILGLNSGSRTAQVAVVTLAVGFALGVAAATAIRPAMPSHGMAAAATEAAMPGRMDLPASTTAAAGYPAQVIRVLDGDTFEARVRVWPGLEVTTKVRVRGIDAPELRARCGAERVQAEAARDALSGLLAQGRVGISQVSLDKYGGRVVADATAANTASIAAALLAAGHVRRYGGGRRAGWCDGQPS